MTKILTVENKDYAIADLMFSPETVTMLEMACDLDENPKNAIKAITLAYNIILDCMVRGGDVADIEEAKAVLSKKVFNAETIKDFITLMVNV